MSEEMQETKVAPVDPTPPADDGGLADRQQVQLGREAAERAEKDERHTDLYDRWKEGWVDIFGPISAEEGAIDVVSKTVEEQRSEFFADVTDKEIIIMCKMDDENPLTCMDHIVQLMGAGVIPPLPSLKHVINTYTDNIRTIQAEICRAVRRGRVQ